jgi:cell division protein FtsB
MEPAPATCLLLSYRYGKAGNAVSQQFDQNMLFKTLKRKPYFVTNIQPIAAITGDFIEHSFACPVSTHQLLTHGNNLSTLLREVGLVSSSVLMPQQHGFVDGKLAVRNVDQQLHSQRDYELVMAQNAELARENQQLKKENQELRAEIARLHALPHHSQIETLASRLERMEADNSALKQRVNDLEAIIVNLNRELLNRVNPPPQQ